MLSASAKARGDTERLPELLARSAHQGEQSQIWLARPWARRSRLPSSLIFGQTSGFDGNVWFTQKGESNAIFGSLPSPRAAKGRNPLNRGLINFRQGHISVKTPSNLGTDGVYCRRVGASIWVVGPDPRSGQWELSGKTGRLGSRGNG